MIINNLKTISSAKSLESDNKRMVSAHRHNPINRKMVEHYRKSHPLCERCEAHNNYHATQEIHHIIDILDGGSSNEDNLLGVCIPCHELLTMEPVPYAIQRAWKM